MSFANICWTRTVVITEGVLVIIILSLSLLCQTSTDVCSTRVQIRKHIVCYYSGLVSPELIDPCSCTHLILASWTVNTDLQLFSEEHGNLSFVKDLKKRNVKLKVLASVRADLGQLTGNSSTMTNETTVDKLTKNLLNLPLGVGGDEDEFGSSQLDGIELDLVTKTAEHRATHAELLRLLRQAFDEDTGYRQRNESAAKYLLATTVASNPQDLLSAYDFESISRYADMVFLPAYNFSVSGDNATLTHHSRLMGISDMENADSMVDLVISLGLDRRKIVLGVPAFGIAYIPLYANDTKVDSPRAETSQVLPYNKLCHLATSKSWTMERDYDQTGVRIHNGSLWIAYDDPVSIRIKSKFIILRDLSGIGLWNIDYDTRNQSECSERPEASLVTAARDTMATFHNADTKEVMESLEDDLNSYQAESSSPAPTRRDRRSPIYRVTQIVDRSGQIMMITDRTQTTLQCTRQGYYRHPQECGQFYRCVKFNQYQDIFTIFEYDCPAGLVFDERYEVCSWPSVAPPCYGSNEIFAVPKDKFICSAEGFYRDPTNCRWFYKCTDFYSDGLLTTFEFRCPYDLAFDEENVMCTWKWLVPSCGEMAGLSEGRLSYEPVPSFNSLYAPTVISSRATIVNPQSSNAEPNAGFLEEKQQVPRDIQAATASNAAEANGRTRHPVPTGAIVSTVSSRQPDALVTIDSEDHTEHQTSVAIPLSWPDGHFIAASNPHHKADSESANTNGQTESDVNLRDGLEHMPRMVSAGDRNFRHPGLVNWEGHHGGNIELLRQPVGSGNGNRNVMEGSRVAHMQNSFDGASKPWRGIGQQMSTLQQGMQTQSISSSSNQPADKIPSSGGFDQFSVTSGQPDTASGSNIYPGVTLSPAATNTPGKVMDILTTVIPNDARGHGNPSLTIARLSHSSIGSGQTDYKRRMQSSNSGTPQPLQPATNIGIAPFANEETDEQNSSPGITRNSFRLPAEGNTQSDHTKQRAQEETSVLSNGPFITQKDMQQLTTRGRYMRVNEAGSIVMQRDDPQRLLETLRPLLANGATTSSSAVGDGRADAGADTYSTMESGRNEETQNSNLPHFRVEETATYIVPRMTVDPSNEKILPNTRHLEPAEKEPSFTTGEMVRLSVPSELARHDPSPTIIKVSGPGAQQKQNSGMATSGNLEIPLMERNSERLLRTQTVLPFTDEYSTSGHVGSKQTPNGRQPTRFTTYKPTTSVVTLTACGQDSITGTPEALDKMKIPGTQSIHLTDGYRDEHDTASPPIGTRRTNPALPDYDPSGPTSQVSGTGSMYQAGEIAPDLRVKISRTTQSSTGPVDVPKSHSKGVSTASSSSHVDPLAAKKGRPGTPQMRTSGGIPEFDNVQERIQSGMWNRRENKTAFLPQGNSWGTITTVTLQQETTPNAMNHASMPPSLQPTVTTQDNVNTRHGGSHRLHAAPVQSTLQHSAPVRSTLQHAAPFQSTLQYSNPDSANVANLQKHVRPTSYTTVSGTRQLPEHETGQQRPLSYEDTSYEGEIPQRAVLLEVGQTEPALTLPVTQDAPSLSSRHGMQPTIIRGPTTANNEGRGKVMLMNDPERLLPTQATTSTATGTHLVTGVGFVRAVNLPHIAGILPSPDNVTGEQGKPAHFVRNYQEIPPNGVISGTAHQIREQTVPTSSDEPLGPRQQIQSAVSGTRTSSTNQRNNQMKHTESSQTLQENGRPVSTHAFGQTTFIANDGRAVLNQAAPAQPNKSETILAIDIHKADGNQRIFSNTAIQLEMPQQAETTGKVQSTPAVINRPLTTQREIMQTAITKDGVGRVDTGTSHALKEPLQTQRPTSRHALLTSTPTVGGHASAEKKEVQSAINTAGIETLLFTNGDTNSPSSRHSSFRTNQGLIQEQIILPTDDVRLRQPVSTVRNIPFNTQRTQPTATTTSGGTAAMINRAGSSSILVQDGPFRNEPRTRKPVGIVSTLPNPAVVGQPESPIAPERTLSLEHLTTKANSPGNTGPMFVAPHTETASQLEDVSQPQTVKTPSTVRQIQSITARNASTNRVIYREHTEVPRPNSPSRSTANARVMTNSQSGQEQTRPRMAVTSEWQKQFHNPTLPDHTETPSNPYLQIPETKTIASLEQTKLEQLAKPSNTRIPLDQQSELGISNGGTFGTIDAGNQAVINNDETGLLTQHTEQSPRTANLAPTNPSDGGMETSKPAIAGTNHQGEMKLQSLPDASSSSSSSSLNQQGASHAATNRNAKSMEPNILKRQSSLTSRTSSNEGAQNTQRLMGNTRIPALHVPRRPDQIGITDSSGTSFTWKVSFDATVPSVDQFLNPDEQNEDAIAGRSNIDTSFLTRMFEGPVRSSKTVAPQDPRIIQPPSTPPPTPTPATKDAGRGHIKFSDSTLTERQFSSNQQTSAWSATNSYRQRQWQEWTQHSGNSAPPRGTTFGLKPFLASARGPQQTRSDAQVYSSQTETYAGPVACERPGLFRHPEDCNQFYECYWDRWIKKFTIHFFDCPVKLVYDNSVTACNWPAYGPTCVNQEIKD